MKVIHSDKAPKAVGPYSQAIASGGFIFCSGQVPLDTQGNIVSQEVKQQAIQVMNNIGEVLKAAGSDYSKIVKVTIFLQDLADYSTVNEVYASYFQEVFPARSCIQVARLPLDAKVEIEVTATA